MTIDDDGAKTRATLPKIQRRAARGAGRAPPLACGRCGQFKLSFHQLSLEGEESL
jgi:hypothetical protein